MENPDDVYFKSPESIWFDGYDGQRTVVLDDFRKNWMTFGFLLRVLDVYPLQVQRKGSSVYANWTQVFITCPQPPTELYATHENVAQLSRRVTKVFSFPEDKDYLEPLGPEVFSSGEFPERVAEIFN